MAKKDDKPGSGIRSARTTSLFRAVNFELFATPVSYINQRNSS